VGIWRDKTNTGQNQRGSNTTTIPSSTCPPCLLLCNPQQERNQTFKQLVSTMPQKTTGNCLQKSSIVLTPFTSPRVWQQSYGSLLFLHYFSWFQSPCCLIKSWLSNCSTRFWYPKLNPIHGNSINWKNCLQIPQMQLADSPRFGLREAFALPPRCSGIHHHPDVSMGLQQLSSHLSMKTLGTASACWI